MNPYMVPVILGSEFYPRVNLRKKKRFYYNKNIYKKLHIKFKQFSKEVDRVCKSVTYYEFSDKQVLYKTLKELEYNKSFEGLLE